MTTDLETRLHRYGATLDNTSTNLVPAPDRHTTANLAELELNHTASRPRRRTRNMIAAAGLVAATSAAFVTTINQRDTPTPAPATAPTSPGAEWPVRMGPGLTPWFELNDEVIAMMGLQAAQPGPAQRSLRCTSWTVESQTVICSSLAGEGYLPAVTYPGAPGPDAAYAGRYVEISTLHADIDAATYATNYSQGKDVGHEDTPLPQQDVRIGGAPARLIETNSGIRRVTWSPQPGVLVAVETGPGLSSDEALVIADNIMPTPTSPTIPLVLAANEADEAIALGGVINGEVCLATPTGCTTMQTGTTASSALYTHPTDHGIAGLAAPDVVSIRATWPDGFTADMTPTPQPIGITQAFALLTDSPVTLAALDAFGNTIPATELTTKPTAPATVSPTTVTLDTAPPTNTPTANIVSPPPSIPQQDLDLLGIAATPRYTLSVQGMHLFVVTPDNTTTGIIIDAGEDGYVASWFGNEVIAGGSANHYRPVAPTFLAGIVADDVTNIIVNGDNIPIVDRAWLTVPSSTVSSYTVIRDNGTTQTVDLTTDLTPPAKTG